MSVQGSTVASASAAAADPSLLDGAVSTLRRHAPGIAVALVLAAVLVYPRWWAVATDADDGVRVPISPYAAGAIGFDETLYMSTVRQAYDGAIPVSDPYLANHDDGVPQRSAIPLQAIAVFGHATDGPFAAQAVATTLFAALALIGLYAMGFSLTRSRVAAIALMPLVLVGIDVLNHADGILPLRHGDVLQPLLELEPRREAHPWTRFAAPILVLAPFFAMVISMPKAVESGERRWTVLAVVSLAALVYTYVYYWTAAALALGGWLTYLWFFSHRQEAMRLARIGAIAGLLALPELVIIAWGVIELPADVRERLGQGDLGLDTSQAMRIVQRLAFGAPFLLALWGGPARNYLYVALFLAPLVLMPITGVIPQEWHYRTQVWGVFALPAVVAGGARIVGLFGRKEWARVAAPVALAVAVGAGVYVAAMQARFVTETEDGFVITDDEDAALEWMRANLDGETVVSASITTNLLMANLSPTSQYLADGGFSIASNDELFERVLRAQAAYGYSEDEAFSRLDLSGTYQGFPTNDRTLSTPEQERDLENYLAFFTFAFKIEDQASFAAEAEALRPHYRELLEAGGVLSEYPAEYLYCGHRERFFGGDSAAPGTYVAPAFESGDVAVYEIVDADAAGAVEFEGCGAAGSSATSAASR